MAVRSASSAYPELISAIRERDADAGRSDLFLALRKGVFAPGYLLLQRTMEDAAERCARGELLPERHVRRLWAGSFDNVSEGRKEECELLLGWTFENAVAMGCRSAAEWYERYWGNSQGTYDHLHDRSRSPLLQFRDGEVVVAVNMVSGITVGPAIFEALRIVGREPAGFVLFSWSVNGETRLPGGGRMRNEFYITPRSRRFVEERAGMDFILVDDCVMSGLSFRNSVESFGKMGATSIYVGQGAFVGKDLGVRM